MVSLPLVTAGPCLGLCPRWRSSAKLWLGFIPGQTWLLELPSTPFPIPGRLRSLRTVGTVSGRDVAALDPLPSRSGTAARLIYPSSATQSQLKGHRILRPCQPRFQGSAGRTINPRCVLLPAFSSRSSQTSAIPELFEGQGAPCLELRVLGEFPGRVLGHLSSPFAAPAASPGLIQAFFKFFLNFF